MYCVKYSNLIKSKDNQLPCTPCYFGFLKPYNATRDKETYSLTYLPTSVLTGIEQYIGLPVNSILRHKLTFDKNVDNKEQVKTCQGETWVDGTIYKLGKDGSFYSVHLKHYLTNPELILAFATHEEAEMANNSSIYLGQKEYIIYPSGVFELTEEEFNNLPGVETFSTTDENAVCCGFNRFKNNEPQYVDIVRKEWE